jgi:hypothetical protein
MADPTSLSDINLAPIAGKQYLTLEREWREEFIYFLMVDRFHDDLNRAPDLKSARSAGNPDT